jgi:hypothetical protein
MPGKVANRSTALSTYITTLNIVAPSSHMGGLNARFSSFANTIQTRLNSSNGTTGGLGGTLEAQVNSALSQVLRQNGNGATTAVATRPADTSITSMVGGGGGLQPAMSPYQAALLRESRITQADFLSILDSLQPLSPFTDPGDVAALQAVVRAEVTALLEEFSYARLLPRQQRVRVFLGGLLGWSYDFFGAASPFAPGAPAGDIQALVYLLNLGGPLIPTLSVEDQLASQQVLGTDGALLDTQWRAFWSTALQNTRPALPVRRSRPGRCGNGTPAGRGRLPSPAAWETCSWPTLLGLPCCRIISNLSCSAQAALCRRSRHRGESG